jgi:ATP-dependent RNA helicase MSS116
LATHNASRGAITSRFFHVSPAIRHAAAATQNRPSSYETGDSTGPQEVPTLTQFKELVDHKLVHPNIVRAIVDDMGHHTMTDVQRLTIRDTLRGSDV